MPNTQRRAGGKKKVVIFGHATTLGEATPPLTLGARGSTPPHLPRVHPLPDMPRINLSGTHAPRPPPGPQTELNTIVDMETRIQQCVLSMARAYRMVRIQRGQGGPGTPDNNPTGGGVRHWSCVKLVRAKIGWTEIAQIFPRRSQDSAHFFTRCIRRRTKRAVRLALTQRHLFQSENHPILSRPISKGSLPKYLRTFFRKKPNFFPAQFSI